MQQHSLLQLHQPAAITPPTLTLALHTLTYTPLFVCPALSLPHRVWRLAVPLMVNNIAGYALSIVGAIYIGRLGALPLAASVLANSLYNCTGLSLALGLSAGMETLCGQVRVWIDDLLLWHARKDCVHAAVVCVVEWWCTSTAPTRHPCCAHSLMTLCRMWWHNLQVVCLLLVAAAGVWCRCLPACGCGAAACPAGVLDSVPSCGAAVVSGEVSADSGSSQGRGPTNQQLAGVVQLRPRALVAALPQQQYLQHN